MSLKRDKDAERRAEAAFAIQSQAIAQQQQLLEQQASQSQGIIDLLNAAEAGNQEARDLVMGDLERAIEGRPNPALDAFLQDVESQGAETIRRQFGIGGETGTGALGVRKNVDLTKAQVIEQSRLGDINAAVGATSNIANIEDARVGRLLDAINNPLQGSQALGQSAAQFGALNQFTPDTFARDLGAGALNFLGSAPNAISNIGSNVSGIGSFLSGGAFGTSFPQQSQNAFNQQLQQAKALGLIP